MVHRLDTVWQDDRRGLAEATGSRDLRAGSDGGCRKCEGLVLASRLRPAVGFSQFLMPLGPAFDALGTLGTLGRLAFAKPQMLVISAISELSLHIAHRDGPLFLTMVDGT